MKETSIYLLADRLCDVVEGAERVYWHERRRCPNAIAAKVTLFESNIINIMTPDLLLYSFQVLGAKGCTSDLLHGELCVCSPKRQIRRRLEALEVAVCALNPIHIVHLFNRNEPPFWNICAYVLQWGKRDQSHRSRSLPGQSVSAALFDG